MEMRRDLRQEVQVSIQRMQSSPSTSQVLPTLASVLKSILEKTLIEKTCLHCTTTWQRQLQLVRQESQQTFSHLCESFLERPIARLSPTAAERAEGPDL